MSKDNKTNLKARHGANYRQNDTNSSFNSSIINMSAESKKGIKYQREPRCKKSDVTGVITHFFVKQAVATDDNSGYYSVTTKLLAVKPSRHTLAIFMPRICLTTNQQINKGMNKNTSVFIQARHIFSAVTGANIYDGLIEPNKIPLVGNKLNRLVTVVKTRHPFFMGGNKLTKLLGAIHHG